MEPASPRLAPASIGANARGNLIACGIRRKFQIPWQDPGLASLTGGGEYFRRLFGLGEQMGSVIQFVPRKPDPDREARLIQEARAIYESIFPTEIAHTSPAGPDDNCR